MAFLFNRCPSCRFTLLPPVTALPRALPACLFQHCLQHHRLSFLVFSNYLLTPHPTSSTLSTAYRRRQRRGCAGHLPAHHNPPAGIQPHLPALLAVDQAGHARTYMVCMLPRLIPSSCGPVNYSLLFIRSGPALHCDLPLRVHPRARLLRSWLPVPVPVAFPVHACIPSSFRGKENLYSMSPSMKLAADGTTCLPSHYLGISTHLQMY